MSGCCLPIGGESADDVSERAQALVDGLGLFESEQATSLSLGPESHTHGETQVMFLHVN